MPNDKPIDTIDTNNQDTKEAPQTDEQQKLALRVQSLFRASYTAKMSLGLPDIWRKCDDYKHNRQGTAQNADDPNSVTNVIHPIIESQIADLVDKPYNVQAKPNEFSDQLYAEQVQHMMQYILDKNQFVTKLNLSEHDRLELGTAIYKVYFDEDALEGRGLPTMEPISPANFFNDPKVPNAYQLQQSEFLIHAVPRPLSWYRKMFPKIGQYVQRQVTVPYDPNIFEGQNADLVQTDTSERALCIECYMKDDKGELYCLTVANNILLEDSRTISKKKLQRRNKFPFVVIPCYTQRGMIWGQGDAELLIPTQDLINELDDQIRINARLMGNPQIVVGMGAGKGFDFRKWTSAPGLRVPMRDSNAFRIVEARPVSPDVPARREKAFEEADKISGRPDVNRGESPGGITAARAIMALQQAGQKGVAHKARMFKDGYAQVLALLYDEMLENWDAEMWVRVDGQQPDWKYYDPRTLTQTPVMIPNGAAQPGEDALKQLTDKKGNPMTRDASFDFELSIGDGFPTDKTFMLQMMEDMMGKFIGPLPILAWSEIRDYLRNEVGMPLQNDDAVQKQYTPPPPPQAPGLPGAPMGGNVVPMPQQGGGPVGNLGQG